MKFKIIKTTGRVVYRVLITSLLSTISFFLLSTSVFATTYSYVGSNFIAGQVTLPYTTSMHLTGSITTSLPIPPNSSISLTDPIVTSWSFNDGVQTLNNTNSSNFPPPFIQSSLSTDASGAISFAIINIGETPIPTALGQFGNAISLAHNFPSNTQGIAAGRMGLECTASAGGVCTAYNFNGSTSHGATAPWGQFNNQLGSWSRSIQAENVPSLSTWGIILLVLSLLFFSQKKMRFLLVKSSK